VYKHLEKKQATVQIIASVFGNSSWIWTGVTLVKSTDIALRSQLPFPSTLLPIPKYADQFGKLFAAAGVRLEYQQQDYMRVLQHIYQNHNNDKPLPKEDLENTLAILKMVSQTKEVSAITLVPTRSGVLKPVKDTVYIDNESLLTDVCPYMYCC
jgi:hypothetical protein